MFHVKKPSDFNAGDPNGNRTRVFAVKKQFAFEIKGASHIGQPGAHQYLP